MTTLDAALQLAKRGFAVFPVCGIEGGRCTCGNDNCDKPGKHPFPKTQGFKDASKAPADVKAMWDRHPHANIGIACGPASGVWVLDIDAHQADANGEASLSILEAKHGRLPQTLTAKTGGGGWHFFFKYGGVEIRNKTGLAPGIDVRGEGGYVIAPPSVHASGRGYEWKAYLAAVEPAPEWLIKLVCPQQPSPRAAKNIVEGQRNSRLTSIAGGLRAHGADERSIFEELLRVNQTTCDPPLSQKEVAGIARSVASYPAGFELTDVGNGKRFATQHGTDAVYCYPWRTWLFWDGKRFRAEDDGEATRRAKSTAASIYAEATQAAVGNPERAKAIAKHAAASQQRPRMEAMLHMAQSELPAVPSSFDASDFLLNLDNGTLDLKTLTLCDHLRDDRITKLAPVALDPAARCPHWLAFLDRIYSGDAELIAFLQRAVGYSLTASTSEQVLFLLHGTGANGKSTLLETLLALMGDYARPTEFRTLLARDSSDAVRNDLAALVALRLVTSVEVGRGKRLDEAMVKQITGGDTITARRLFQEFFDFKPRFKLWLAANVQPEIRGVDEGIWRRVLMVPHDVFIPPEERDRDLPVKLIAELPGILNWAIEGLRAWRRIGLAPPDKVRAATAEYRADMDMLGDFLDARCAVGVGFHAATGALYSAYEGWAFDNGEEPVKKRTFGAMLKERGFRDDTMTIGGRKQRVKLGLALVCEEAPM
jgi:putative DNA primase/helicase